MSDIRFNQWLHNSGTGGVSQVDGGHVGIGTTNPLIPVGSGVTAVLNVGVVTANYYYGDGSNLSGVQVGGASSISFNDNIGAYFGNSQDLKIHHDGNHSYIDDQGTGNLRLRSGTLEILNLAGNKTSAIFSSGGAQTLNFNNNTKFVTTNTGIDVTGSVVADDLVITGPSVVADLKSTNNNYVLGLVGNNASDKVYLGTTSGNDFIIANTSSVTERFRITSAGHLLHGVTVDEDTSGSGGLRFINSGDIQIDGDQKALVFRSTNSTAQKQSGIEWWNETAAGVQCSIFGIREAVSQAPSALAFYTSDNVDTSSNNGEGNITERLRITSAGDTELRNDVAGINDSYSQYLKFRTTQSNGQSAITGAIRAQGKSNWGGELVFYSKPANGSPNDTVTERLRITSGGNVNIGGEYTQTTYPFQLTGSGGGDAAAMAIKNLGSHPAKLHLMSGHGNWSVSNSSTVGDAFEIRDESANSTRMIIASDGKIGINKTSPSWMLDIENTNPGNDSKQQIQRWVNGGQNTLELNMYGGSVDQCQFAATNSEQTISFLTGRNTGSDVVSTETSLLMTQNRDLWNQGPDSSVNGGGLFIGRSASPYGNLAALRDNNYRPIIYLAGRYPEISLIHEVPDNTNHASGIRFATYIQSTNTATGNQFVIGPNGPGTYLDIGHATAAQNQNVHAGISNHSGTTRFRVTTSGCQVFGSFSKSSGSFKIPHPLSEKVETHELVHSFIEGPQADLIYRGVVDLKDGTATVNIDTAGRMTQGTFDALCTNVSCFTSNETDWTAVKGSISGNILTITAQDNTSTATVSWMVVGERKDQHMKDTNWTDDNGRVITEPLKSS